MTPSQGTRGFEKELPKSLTVGLHILNVNASETLTDGAGTLICRQDSLARSGNVLGSLDQLISKREEENIHVMALNIQQQ